MLYAAALTFILIHAIRSIDLTQRYRKSQFAALAVSALLIAHMFLVFITSGALADDTIYEVGYKEYMRSPNQYTGASISTEVTVWKCVQDNDTLTVYAYDEKQSEMFCITASNFENLLWYDFGGGYVGLPGEAYLAMPEDLRLKASPIPKVEKLLKGDTLGIVGVGNGITEEGEPRIEAVLIWVNK